jgi:hypothetical protein
MTESADKKQRLIFDLCYVTPSNVDLFLSEREKGDYAASVIMNQVDNYIETMRECKRACLCCRKIFDDDIRPITFAVLYPSMPGATGSKVAVSAICSSCVRQNGATEKVEAEIIQTYPEWTIITHGKSVAVQ